MKKQSIKRKRTLIFIMTFIIAVFTLCTSCSLYPGRKYGNVKVGEVFYEHSAGYYEKLPKGYCLSVILGDVTELFWVSEEQEDIPFCGNRNHPAVYNNPMIMSAHYIKCYYNNDYLILCEELEDESLVYWSFCFDDRTITRYDTAQEVFDLYNFDSGDWSSLCNRYDQIID